MTDPLQVFRGAAEQRVNGALTALFTDLASPAPLLDAMRYAVLNGGKRLRPTLVYAAYGAVTAQPALVDSASKGCDAAAIAVELVHSYSLVHDDLPAMDDDDLRRGQPSCHKAFDEATAILAGDALQALAFAQLGRCEALSGEQRARLVSLLADAAGADGMVGGQTLDLNALKSPQLSLSDLEQLHRAKTGALITAALLMGAACADAPPQQNHILREFGGLVGLAFQVVDDVLDVTTPTELLGKQQGADEQKGKPTYTTLMGVEGAQMHARELCQQAQALLEPLGDNALVLSRLADYIVERSS